MNRIYALTTANLHKYNAAADELRTWAYDPEQHFTANQIVVIEKALTEPLTIHISEGNRKIGSCPNFSTLPGFTCGSVAAHTCYCGRECYAKRENRFPAVLFNRTQNTLLCMIDLEWVHGELIDYLKEYQHKPVDGIRCFRWHEAGDIMNAAYLDMMNALADEFPKVWFYTYTKQYTTMLESGYSRKDLFHTKHHLSILISTWCNLYDSEKAQIDELKKKGFKTASLLGDEFSEGATPCRNQTEGINCNKCGICQTGQQTGFKKH